MPDTGAERNAKRIAKLFEDSGMGHPNDGARKPTGYKIHRGWTAPGQPEAPHKKGEVLTASEISVPEGYDRKALIDGLVRDGKIVPQYAEDDKPVPLPPPVPPRVPPVPNTPPPPSTPPPPPKVES